MNINVVGIGPAGMKWLTAEGKEAIEEAALIIGTKRQLETVETLTSAAHECYAYESLTKDLLSKIDNHKGDSSIAVLGSGDPSLYGIGKYLIGRYGPLRVSIICGISSLQYLFSKAKLDMNDVYLTSCHGRQVDFDRVFAMPKTGLLTDELLGPHQIAAEALKRGINPQIIIGEMLGYAEEQVEITCAEDVVDRHYGLNAVIVINEITVSVIPETNVTVLNENGGESGRER